MGPTASADILFYATAWFLAATCGLLVTFRDRRYRSFAELVATASLSGFISVSALGIILRTLGGSSGSEPYYLGIAIAIGLLGEKGLVVAHRLLSVTLKKFGVSVDDYSEEEGRSIPEDNSCDSSDSSLNSDDSSVQG